MFLEGNIAIRCIFEVSVGERTHKNFWRTQGDPGKKKKKKKKKKRLLLAMSGRHYYDALNGEISSSGIRPTTAASRSYHAPPSPIFHNSLNAVAIERLLNPIDDSHDEASGQQSIPSNSEYPEPTRKLATKNPHNFSCPFEGCECSFTMRNNMLAHFRAHTRKDYVCNYPGCGKAFSLAAVLCVHRRVHTGEKPYTCQFDGCGKRFANSGAFARHRRIHTGERPFVCNACGNVYTQSGNLRRHVLRHGGR
jgi:hypothetical protein